MFLKASSVAVVLLVFGTHASAQDAAEWEQKLLFGGGVGGGLVTCSECFGDWDSGVSGFVTVRWPYGSRMSVGLEVGAWARREEGTMIYRLDYLVMSSYAPFLHRRLFLKGAVGLGTMNAALSGVGTAREVGLAVVTGIGWNLGAGDQFSWSIWADGAASFQDDRTYGIHLGVGTSWR